MKDEMKQGRSLSARKITLRRTASTGTRIPNPKPKSYPFPTKDAASFPGPGRRTRPADAEGIVPCICEMARKVIHIFSGSHGAFKYPLEAKRTGVIQMPAMHMGSSRKRFPAALLFADGSIPCELPQG